MVGVDDNRPDPAGIELAAAHAYDAPTMEERPPWVRPPSGQRDHEYWRGHHQQARRANYINQPLDLRIPRRCLD